MKTPADRDPGCAVAGDLLTTLRERRDALGHQLSVLESMARLPEPEA